MLVTAQDCSNVGIKAWYCLCTALNFSIKIKMTSHQIKYALDLMKRLPPHQAQRNMNDLLRLVPRIDDQFDHLDQPFQIGKDTETGKNYVLCCYNKCGNSYRSPWSNIYTPILADGALPSEQLRRLEVEANYAFDQYRELYFQGGVSSVYFWDTSDGFAGAILIKNYASGSKQATGFWDSTHIVEVQKLKNGTRAQYRLRSSVMLWLQTSGHGSGNSNLGAKLTKEVESNAALTSACSHISNIGRLVEEMENRIRNEFIEIYFAKIKNIANSLRSLQQLTKNKIVPYGILRAIQDAD